MNILLFKSFLRIDKKLWAIFFFLKKEEENKKKKRKHAYYQEYQLKLK